MFTRTIPILGLATALAAFGACGGEGGEGGETMPQPGTAAPQAPPPDTTAAALWAHLDAEQYQRNWALYPGQGRLYEGAEPHGMLLTTYVNSLAQDAVTNAAGSMPVGAIVVKENYMPDSTLAAVTVMYKAAGYDPANNDWFWLKRLADGTVEVEGRGQGCINCHGGKRDNDFIFTSSLAGQ